jgi:hypothetical protein
MYKNISADTVLLLDQWLHDNCNGSYNLNAGFMLPMMRSII